MAPAFVFPSNLEALEDDPSPEDQRLSVVNPLDLTTLRSSDIEELVKGVVFDLSDGELYCVEQQDVFDRLYSLVKGYSHLSLSSKINLIETLRSNFGVLIPTIDSISQAQSAERSSTLSSPLSTSLSLVGDRGDFSAAGRLASLRNSLKIYTFFLLSIVCNQESADQELTAATSKGGAHSRKKNTTKGWNWEHQRARILSLVAMSMEINISLLFGSSNIDENHVSFVTRCVFTFFENQVLLKDANSRECLYRIIGTVSTKLHLTSQSSASILHLVYKFDFAVPYLADSVCLAQKKYSDGTLVVSLIREIGRTDPKDFVRDTVGAENVGRFLVDLADKSPKLMATNIGILIPHFGGESYKIRNSLVSVLGKLVEKPCKDVDADLNSKSLRLRGKQAMLELLLERCRDTSAYTRSRVLHVWTELCEASAISIAHWNEVACLAAGRLEDKSTLVRKSALNLLIAMLQHNPFGPQLQVAVFEETLKKLREELHKMEHQESSEDFTTSTSDLSLEESTRVHQESLSDSCLPELHTTEHQDSSEEFTTSILIFEESKIGDQDSLTDSCLPCDNEKTGTDVLDIANLEQTRVLVASLDAGVRFIKCISSAQSILVQLLASSSSTDVENTILLLMRCKQFQINGSEACLRKMFPLVFSQDKTISEAVENAFIMIYLTKNPTETAENLLNLAIDSNIGDLAALEFLVGSLMFKGEISISTISCLWDFFSFNISGVTAWKSRGALSILCMIAKSSPKILSSHLQDIIDIGFGRWSREEPLLARTACIALEMLSLEDKERLVSSIGSKVFYLLRNLVTGSSLPDHIWYAAADKAIGVIYSIHPTPETFAADIVKKSLDSVFSYNGNVESVSENKSGNCSFLSTISTSNLGRYLFILSHVALCQMVYIESCVRKIQKQKCRKKITNFESVGVDGDCADLSDKKDGIGAELGLAASEDMIIDGLSEKAEKEIVSSCSEEKNLIGICTPFLSKLCRNYTLLQKFPILQASAMLALCRLMIIDADFCEANLQLLFTVMESAPSEAVRSNCTVSLGDLAIRFPNLVEPWTENMYARLHDPSPSVRKNAVLVLSHLILNDMMKVKGYIDEMAMLLEDEDDRISNLVKLFFHELSKKGSNPIYNLLPDILGRLSNKKLNEEAFRNIMQFLINSIKKDKQMDALVEKLCNRFCGDTDVRQWENIAYCLSQLAFTERGLKKLMESVKSYEHVLGEDSVVNYFRNIISKGKKFAKPELKSCIEEFEDKLNKFHAERSEQEITARNAEEHQNRVGNLKVMVESEEDNSEVETSVVIDPSQDQSSGYNGLKSKNNRSRGSSVSSRSDAENGDEVQSPKTSRKGISKYKGQVIKESAMKDQTNIGSTRRKLRSTKSVADDIQESSHGHFLDEKHCPRQLIESDKLDLI